MSWKKMKLESAEDDIQTVQVLCKSYVLVACLLCIYPHIAALLGLNRTFLQEDVGHVPFSMLPQDDGGEEVEEMPEIELSSDSEVSTLNFYYFKKLAQMISG